MTRCTTHLVATLRKGHLQEIGRTSDTMKNANVVTVIVFVTFVFGLTALDLLNGPAEISVAERRKLAQAPALSLGGVLDGTFAEDYSSFLQDQVVFRDGFRAIKAYVELRLLRKRENNGVYVVDGELYDKFYGVNGRYIERAAGLINEIIGSIDAGRVYLSVIPSKAHALDQSRYLLSDQAVIGEALAGRVNASYIDLMPLCRESGRGMYYRTDHHWTTPGAIQAYETLIAAMGYAPVEEYDLEIVTDTFVGSNYGRAALRSIPRDEIHLAHNAHLDGLSACRYGTAGVVTCFDSVYFREKANGLDPYDVFLGGAAPIIVIENQRFEGDEELVLFKDSYSHVLAPFLAQHFRRVILFDLRYVRRAFVLDHFDLDGKVLLFLYSTTILNTDPQILN
jgi:hypothetical protein